LPLIVRTNPRGLRERSVGAKRVAACRTA
jgi:hypothetical protein